MKIFLICAFAIMACQANMIKKIEMQTSDEPDSGMNHLFGQVTLDVSFLTLMQFSACFKKQKQTTTSYSYLLYYLIQICRAPGDCCSTNVLDNPFEDNFQGILNQQQMLGQT